MSRLKNVEQLTVDDLRAFPVWQYTNAHEGAGETVVGPVERIPVQQLAGRIVGAQVKLANGSARWALIGNVDLSNPRLTQHFLTLSIVDRDRWFTMARYHDLDANERGPLALAAFLELPVDAVFPIAYDISRYCIGDASALTGMIDAEPRERLTRAQIVALAVP